MAVAQFYPGRAGSAALGTAASGLTYPPSIVANRRRVDNHFPSVAFTVNAGGQPYFEVLLATDATLFDPANAARRAANNFYSSRTHHGLSEAAEAAHPYLVPSAVLRGFVAATPRPTAIYYTLIAYASPDGANPTFSHSPTALPSSAPSVAVAPDFSGNTLATVLSASVDKLRFIGGLGLAASAPPPLSAEDDRGEGEDGFGAPQPVMVTPPPQAPPLPPPPPPSPQRMYAAPAALADASYDLAVLPATNGHRNGHSAVLDPLLPSVRTTREQRDYSARMSAGLGMDYPTEQTDMPEYLQDDEDTEPYRDEAEALQFVPAGHYLALDNDEAGRPLTVEDKIRIIEHVAPFESGGDYGAINADGEFEGRFGSNHPAYQRYHIGLSYGLIQFTQDSGMLGQLLGMMRDRDAQEFARIFGSDADELVRVTNLEGPPSSAVQGGRSVRVQPIGGSDLWQEPWLSRFRAAGQVERFKAAQRELAARGYLDPMLRFAKGFGLDTERALTLTVDRAIQMGVNGAKRWIAAAIGPLGAESARRMALGVLGHADLRSFQAATPGLTVDGEWGPESHAALVGALRALGSASPVPIPNTEQVVASFVRRAAAESWHARVEALNTVDMPATRYQL